MLIFSPKGLNRIDAIFLYNVFCLLILPVKEHLYLQSSADSTHFTKQNRWVHLSIIPLKHSKSNTSNPTRYSILRKEPNGECPIFNWKLMKRQLSQSQLHQFLDFGWSSLLIDGLDSIAAISRSLRELLSISQGPNPALRSNYTSNSSSSSMSMLTSTSSMSSFSRDLVTSDYSADRILVSNEFNHLIVSSYPADLIYLVHREQRIGISQSATNII